MSAYFNENDPAAAAWLRNLISAGLIAPGVVDERSIADVQSNDLEGFTQHHFFAGIGGWSYALRLSDWPDDRPVWTGSCPCQPFSVAGRGKGDADARHLWPHFARLIDACRPSVIFGEQVASAAGRVWLSRVRVDLEALGYGVGCADLCAAGVGAPHIRQRLWWVADSERDTGGAWRVAGEPSESVGTARAGASTESGRCGSVGRLADSNGAGRDQLPPSRIHGRWEATSSEEPAQGNTDGARGNDALGCGTTGGLGNADNAGSQGWGVLPERTDERSPWAASLGNWIPCADGKARRLEPGLEPLAHGIPARVASLRGYGNAIVPQVAEAFIRAYNEI